MLFSFINLKQTKDFWISCFHSCNCCLDAVRLDQDSTPKIKLHPVNLKISHCKNVVGLALLVFTQHTWRVSSFTWASLALEKKHTFLSFCFMMKLQKQVENINRENLNESRLIIILLVSSLLLRTESFQTKYVLKWTTATSKTTIWLQNIKWTVTGNGLTWRRGNIFPVLSRTGASRRITEYHWKFQL